MWGKRDPHWEKPEGGVYLTESVLWAVEDRASQLYISKRIVVGRYYGFFVFFFKVLFVCV